MVCDTRLLLRHLRERDRALPDVLIIGAHKCGTTSFYRNLTAHPQILPALTKEVHFFDRNPRPPLWWYRAHFPPSRALRDGAITAEATPSYALLPDIARAARDLIPKCRLMILLRDPVQRAYSAFQFNARRNAMTISFEDWIDRDMRQLDGRRTAAELFQDQLGGFASVESVPTGLMRGIYIEQIRNWRAFFPEDQLLIIDSAEYFADPPAMLRRVATGYLGLPDHEFQY